MIRALIHGDPDWAASLMPMLMLPAFLACYLCVRFHIPGILSCFQLAAFAVSAATFTEYRTERGLWMLATLFFAIWGGVLLLWFYGQAQDWVRGVAPDMTLIIDAAIATLIMHGHTKFLWRLIFLNLSISRQ